MLNACSDDAQFANDAAWDSYVTASTAEAAVVVECMECAGAPAAQNLCSDDEAFTEPGQFDLYVEGMKALHGSSNCDITTTGGNTCTLE